MGWHQGLGLGNIIPCAFDGPVSSQILGGWWWLNILPCPPCWMSFGSSWVDTVSQDFSIGAGECKDMVEIPAEAY